MILFLDESVHCYVVVTDASSSFVRGCVKYMTWTRVYSPSKDLRTAGLGISVLSTRKASSVRNKNPTFLAISLSSVVFSMVHHKQPIMPSKSNVLP